MILALPLTLLPLSLTLLPLPLLLSLSGLTGAISRGGESVSRLLQGLLCLTNAAALRLGRGFLRCCLFYGVGGGGDIALVAAGDGFGKLLQGGTERRVSGGGIGSLRELLRELLALLRRPLTLLFRQILQGRFELAAIAAGEGLPDLV